MQYFLLNLIVFLVSIATSHSSQWIDPHNMKMNEKAKYNMKYLVKKTIVKPEDSLSEAEVSVDVPFNLSNSVLKRILLILMKSAHVDKNDPENYTGDIQFNIHPKDYDFLNSVGEKDLLQPDQLRRIDAIFSEGFRKRYIDIYMEEIKAGQTKLYHLVFNMENMWILGTICLMYCMYNLIKNDFSLTYIVKYLFILLLIVDGGYRYNHLLVEAEEHNLGVLYSSKCDTNKMDWSEWTKYMFSSRECEKKTITPLDVLLHQVKNIITVPMEAIGRGMGVFGSKMFTELPWGFKLVMWPIMLIFVLILFFIVMTFYTGMPIEVSLIPLRLKIGRHTPTESKKNLTSESAHPPYIQNINFSVSSGSNQSVKSSNNNSTQSDYHNPQVQQLNKLPLEENIVEDDRESSGTKERETSERGTNIEYFIESKVGEGGDSLENTVFIEEVGDTSNKITESHEDGTLRQRVIADKI